MMLATADGSEVKSGYTNKSSLNYAVNTYWY